MPETSWRDIPKFRFDAPVDLKTKVNRDNVKKNKRYKLTNVDKSLLARGVRIRTNSSTAAMAWDRNTYRLQPEYWNKEKKTTGLLDDVIYCFVEGVITQLGHDDTEERETLADADVYDILWLGESSSQRRFFSELDGTVLLYYNNGDIRLYDSEYNIGRRDFNGDDPTWIEFLTLPRPKRISTVRMNDVVLPEEVRESIAAGISQVKNNELIFETWGFDEVFEKGTAIAILMWGPPGTGKTLACQAIANELGMGLQIVQSGEVWSSEPGGAERAVKEFFKAAEKSNKLLLFDECDSLIADRNEVGMILGAQINALLSALESFNGVCAFTTNRLGKMDPAFERRVSVKVEFPFPDFEARLAIWHKLIPKAAPIGKDVSFDILAGYPIAGGNIKNVILNSARRAAFLGMKTINMDCFMYSLEKEGESMQKFETAFNDQPKISMLGPSAGVKLGENGSLVIDHNASQKQEIHYEAEGEDRDV